MGERWKGSEFEFDPSGKLIIHDRELARQIGEQLKVNGTLEISLEPNVPTPNLLLAKCPPPPDSVCGCNFDLVKRPSIRKTL